MFSPILCCLCIFFWIVFFDVLCFFPVLLHKFNLFGGDYKNNELMPMKGPGHIWRKALNKCKFLFIRTSFSKQGTQTQCSGTTQRGGGGGYGPGTHGDSGRDDGPGAEQGTERESDSRNGSEKWVWAEGLSSLEQIH